MRHRLEWVNRACRRLRLHCTTRCLRPLASGCGSFRCRRRNWCSGWSGHTMGPYRLPVVVKFLALLLLFAGAMAAGQEIVVAAAADMSAALPELSASYTKKTGLAVKL